MNARRRAIYCCVHGFCVGLMVNGVFEQISRMNFAWSAIDIVVAGLNLMMICLHVSEFA